MPKKKPKSKVDLVDKVEREVSRVIDQIPELKRISETEYIEIVSCALGTIEEGLSMRLHEIEQEAQSMMEAEDE
jgi:phosphopantothenate synthetase